jgi:hypothetical protein
LQIFVQYQRAHSPSLMNENKHRNLVILNAVKNLSPRACHSERSEESLPTRLSF